MRGWGNSAPRMGTVGAAHPFTTHAFHWPLNMGIQNAQWTAGGPSGFAGGTAGAVKPWPYITGTKQFISGGQYGAASTLVRNPNNPNLGSGNVKFLPIGITKVQTYTGVSF